MKYEFHPIANEFDLLEGNELQALVDSMRVNGFDREHPVVLYEGKILDGRNRYRAAIAAGVEPRFVEFGVGNPWDFVWRENAVRRHLEAGVRVAKYLVFAAKSETWNLEREEKRRKANEGRAEKALGNQHAAKSPKNSTVQDCTTPKPVPTPAAVSAPRPERTRDTIATRAGVSPRTAATALKLQKEAPAVLEQVAAGKVSLSQATAALKADQRKQVAEQIKAEPTPMPTGPFRVIVIDPPWRYDTTAESDPGKRGTVEYPDMSVEEICDLPLGDIAHDDCILWLWTTNAFMREAYQCLDAWGFKAKTILTWDKVHMGAGHWLRNVTEHCILAVRGKPVVQLTNQTTIIREQRREHSRKPDAFYALVEAVCPGSKVEVFARTPRPGWAAWGAEKEKFDAA